MKLLAVLLFMACAGTLSASPTPGSSDTVPRIAPPAEPADTITPLHVFEPIDSIHGAVRSIRLIGNLKTTEPTILRELTFSPGDRITPDKLLESQHRIYNLGLFNTVELGAVVDSVTRVVDIYIIVRERWYVWPQLILGVKDRDWAHAFTKQSKVYAGLGILHFNVRGRREKLFVGGALGYDPYATLEYSYLALAPSGATLLDASLGTSRIRNLSDTMYTGGRAFNEIRYSAMAQVTRRVTQRLDIALRFELQVLHLSDAHAPLTLSPTGHDVTPMLALAFAYDSRDNAEYPTDGAYLRGSMEKFGAGTYINYNRFAWDLRGYTLTLADISLCGRVAASVYGGGNIPVYQHKFLGLNERVRGEFAVKREGENFALGSVEFRFPLLVNRVISWGSAPNIVPAEFTLGTFGLYATLFTDAGTVWFRNDRLTDMRWSNGVGAGLNILAPYGLIIRLEYAFHGSIRGGEFIFDFAAAL